MERPGAASNTGPITMTTPVRATKLKGCPDDIP